MIPLPATPVAVSEGVQFAFPSDLCCNCGTTQPLQSLAQDTRLTRYMLGGGSEYRFNFALPFCQSCAPSARRRPATLLHKGLVLILVFAVALLASAIAGIGTGASWLLENAALISAVVAVVLTVTWYSTRRPRAGQSSFYQPIRLLKLRQKFLSGTVMGFRLGFTNHLYADHFVSANQQVVSSGLVEVTKL